MFGAAGGIGASVVAALAGHPDYAAIIGLHRTSEPALDLEDERSIARCIASAAASGHEPRLAVLATGFLHGKGLRPERSWRDLDAAHLARAFAINTIGPALVAKHLLPTMPRRGRVVFAALSARVGSIADNRLGGWHAYRSSKAALNQLIRTLAIELRRHNPEAIAMVLHPGTVATPLSAPFATAGLKVQAPAEAAARLLDTIHRLPPESSGGFFDADGAPIPW